MEYGGALGLSTRPNPNHSGGEAAAQLPEGRAGRGKEGACREAGWSQVGHAPQNRGTRGALGGAARRIVGKALAPPEVAVQFSASEMWLPSREAAMDNPELAAVSEDAMDSFLEKFQSQSYRGRFIEDRWEEVSRTWGSSRVWGRCADSWGPRPCAEAPPAAPGPLALSAASA